MKNSEPKLRHYIVKKCRPEIYIQPTPKSMRGPSTVIIYGAYNTIKCPSRQILLFIIDSLLIILLGGIPMGLLNYIIIKLCHFWKLADDLSLWLADQHPSTNSHFEYRTAPWVLHVCGTVISVR